MSHSAQIRFSVATDNSDTLCDIQIERLVIAGWTARDKAAMEAHITELEELGVTRPPRTPMFYPVSTARLTTGTVIEVPGQDASGEVEFVLIRSGGRFLIGCGSDHTDRKVERYDVQVSKQLCDKPIASTLWPLDDVYPNWDRLTLRSHAVIDGERALYQEGPVTAMLDPKALVEAYEREGGHFDDGVAMFCGTLPAHGGVRFADRFEYELTDPVHKRTIASYYDVYALPVAG